MREELEGLLVGEEELLCAVTELVRKMVLSSPGVLGCLVVRLVAGGLGVAVALRVDDMRLGTGTQVVRGVDCEVVDWEESVEEAGALAVVRGVDRRAVVLLEMGTWDGMGETGSGGVVGIAEVGTVGANEGDAEGLIGGEAAEEKGMVIELKVGGLFEVGRTKDDVDGGRDDIKEAEVGEDTCEGKRDVCWAVVGRDEGPELLGRTEE